MDFKVLLKIGVFFSFCGMCTRAEKMCDDFDDCIFYQKLYETLVKENHELNEVWNGLQPGTSSKPQPLGGPSGSFLSLPDPSFCGADVFSGLDLKAKVDDYKKAEAFKNLKTEFEPFSSKLLSNQILKFLAFDKRNVDRESEHGGHGVRWNLGVFNSLLSSLIFNLNCSFCVVPPVSLQSSVVKNIFDLVVTNSQLKVSKFNNDYYSFGDVIRDALDLRIGVYRKYYALGTLFDFGIYVCRDLTGKLGLLCPDFSQLDPSLPNAPNAPNALNSPNALFFTGLASAPIQWTNSARKISLPQSCISDYSFKLHDCKPEKLPYVIFLVND